ncbi:MAG: LTA synthase family protein [Clostridiales bacterium]|nr:LTA synthase family protein [Clostridiales bacterium]
MAALIFLGIGTGLASLMLGASVFGMPMFYSYFSSPLVVLLNLLPPVLLTLLLYWATGRSWIGFAVPALAVLTLSAVSFFKVQIRNEPLVFSDYRLVSEAGDSMAGYSLDVNWKIWAAAVYAAVGTVAAFLLLRHKPQVKTRLIGAVFILVVSILMYGFLYTNDHIYAKAKGSYEISPWSSTEKYIARGFVYPFILSIGDPAAKLPPGYQKDSAAEILTAYGDDAIPEGEKVNIICLMLESYADLSVFDTIDFNVDVYGPLHALQEESLSGSLVVNVFAGGTVDTERAFLTGYTLPGEFMTPVNSYVDYFRIEGYHTEGFHSGDGWYYDRKTVNMNLGFDSYYYLEDFQGSRRWDDYFFPKVLELYEARDQERPYFSYSLSYQNHGPYDSEKTSDTMYIRKGALSDASYNILNNYLEGISDTTRRAADFIDYFRGRSEPVVVVLFGDHKPWLGNNHEVYRELGIDTDSKSVQGFYNLYNTPWLIWANDAARAVLGSDFTGDGGDFSPCFLMNRLFEACAWSGNGYMKAANELKSYVPVVSTSTGFFEENGAVTEELSDKAGAVYENFRRIEYFWKNNDAE